jgi:hypothetical protein
MTPNAVISAAIADTRLAIVRAKAAKNAVDTIDDPALAVADDLAQAEAFLDAALEGFRVYARSM